MELASIDLMLPYPTVMASQRVPYDWLTKKKYWPRLCTVCCGWQLHSSS